MEADCESLTAWSKRNLEPDFTQVVLKLAQGSAVLSMFMSSPKLRNQLHSDQSNKSSGVSINKSGDEQKPLDIYADDLFLQHLKGSSVIIYGSEEQDNFLELNKEGNLLIFIDPLDGSSNLSINGPVGSIFSLHYIDKSDLHINLVEKVQSIGPPVVAGYFIYGPQTELIIAIDGLVSVFSLDKDIGEFLLIKKNVRIVENKAEYAINSSNYRFWNESEKRFIQDCQQGEQGPLGCNYNMRWIGSLVSEVNRILTLGGVFLYPSDRRKGYEKGRLRLNYEVRPISFLIEAAGGKALAGNINAEEVLFESLHQKVEFSFGSVKQMEILSRYKQ